MSDDQLNYRDLQKKCKELGLDATGSKQVLQNRLAAHQGNGSATAANSSEEVEKAEDEADQEQDEQDQEQDEDQVDQEQDEDEQDEDEDDQDEEPMRLEIGENGEAVEVLGVLVRKTGNGNEADEDDESKDLLVPASVLRQAYQDELQDALEAVQEEFEQDQHDEQDQDEDDVEDDDEDEDINLEPTLYRQGSKVNAQFVTYFLCLVEALFVFFALLLQGSSASVSPTGPIPAIATANPASNLTASSGLIEIAGAAWNQTTNLTFWTLLFLYGGSFFVVPTMVGLIFGKYNSPENVFGFAISRAVVYYLMMGVSWGFDWAAFPTVHKLFNVTTVVSLATAFWEKQSEHYI